MESDLEEEDGVVLIKMEKDGWSAEGGGEK